MAPRLPESQRALIEQHLDDLYDFALTVTWDPDRAVQAIEAALTRRLASPSLGQLYGRVRQEALRRAAPVEPVTVRPGPPPSPEELGDGPFEVGALNALSGLDPADRAVLYLSLRKQLGDEELARALSLSPAGARGLVEATRSRADRHLSDYLLARTGAACPDLPAVLRDVPPGLEVLSQAMGRHTEECSVCADRRRELLPPTQFLDTIPARPAPESLRDALAGLRVLSEQPEDGARRRRRLAAGAGAATVAAAVALLTLRIVGEEGRVPPTTTLPREVLTTSSRRVDFGTADTRETLTLANQGDETAPWKAEVEVPWLSVTPAEGLLRPGDVVELTLTLDRGAPPEGEAITTLRLITRGRATTVDVVARVVHPPVVERARVKPSQLAVATCDGARTSAVARARVTDNSRVATVVLEWVTPDGKAGRIAMEPQGDDRYARPFGPFRKAGLARWLVEATDDDGNQVRTDAQTVEVTADCPPSSGS